MIIPALQSELARAVDWVELEAPALDELVRMIQLLPNPKPLRVSAKYSEDAPGAWNCDVVIDRKGTELRLIVEIVAPAGGWQGSLESLVARIRRAFLATKRLNLASSELRSVKKVRDKDSRRSIRAAVPAGVAINLD